MHARLPLLTACMLAGRPNHAYAGMLVLKKLQGRRFVGFEDLFDPASGAPVLVVTFIALLELAKETLIEITQAEAFAPIYVRLAYAPT